MSPNTARHVFFDLDGTLVDTRAAVEGSYRKVFAEHLDSDFPPSGISGEIFAMRPREVFTEIAPDRAKDLDEAYQAAYPECTHLVHLFPGAPELIRGLRAAGRLPSLVTNKGLARTLIDLSVAGISPDHFAAIVTAEDTIERKPHPAPILLGMERAGATAFESIYVGDGPQDVMAARAAGLECIAVSYGFYAADELAGHKPAAIAATVDELAECLGVSPMMDSVT